MLTTQGPGADPTWSMVSGGMVMPDFILTRAGAATPADPRYMTITPGADTALTASTEANDVLWSLNRTQQFATGALTNQRAVYIRKPTYGFVGGSTVTNAATVAIEGAPVAGTNATLTNNWALWVQGDTSRFDGSISQRMSDAVTNATTSGISLLHNSSGVPIIGFGAGINCSLDSDTTPNQPAGSLEWIWLIPTQANKTSLFRVFTVTASGSSAEVCRMGSGTTQFGAGAAQDLVVRTNTTGAGVRVFPAVAGNSAAFSCGDLANTALNYFGAAASAGNFINQTLAGDSFFRSENKNMLYSVDAGNTTALYIKNGSNLVGIGSSVTSPSGQLHVMPVLAATRGLVVQGTASQTGALLALTGKSSTTDNRDMALIDTAWVVSTDASRTGRLVLSAVDFAGTREGMRIEASGSAAMIGFLGHAAAVQQANASQAAITAVTDANAKSSLQAIYNLLLAYGLAPATA